MSDVVKRVGDLQPGDGFWMQALPKLPADVWTVTAVETGLDREGICMVHIRGAESGESGTLALRANREIELRHEAPEATDA